MALLAHMAPPPVSAPIVSITMADGRPLHLQSALDDKAGHNAMVVYSMPTPAIDPTTSSGPNWSGMHVFVVAQLFCLVW